MVGHDFKSRDDVVRHLTTTHGWEDPQGYNGWSVEFPQSQLRDMDAHWLIATGEYLAIHRELHALEPNYRIRTAKELLYEIGAW